MKERGSTDTNPACGNCRYYKDETKPEDEYAHGECSRFPRVWVGDGEGSADCLRPIAYPDEVCGEWKPAQ